MIYKGKQLNQISFPLGGIGTGSIGLSGSGRLIDWEIFGKPNKQSNNGYTHFAIKVEKEGQCIDARVLNGDLQSHYIGNKASEEVHSGYGFGVDPTTMAGFPHFDNVIFKGEFPIADLEFNDSTFDAKVNLTAFNPFIPLDEANSSLPAGFFEYEIENTSDCDLDFTLAFSVQNPTGNKSVVNKYTISKNISFLQLLSNQYDKEDYKYGELCIASDADNISFQEYWYRGGWSDGIETFWNDFTSTGEIRNRRYNNDFKVENKTHYDVGTLAVHEHIKSGQKKKIHFVLAWYYPNMVKSWPVKYDNSLCIDDMPIWKNHYSKMYDSSYHCAQYAIQNFELLLNKTRLFKDALYGSTLPKEEIDAISSNLSTLKSPTVLRLTDGSFYGFEGCIEDSGCCEGSCQHVWNYAYALPFLFPSLERSMRELEYRYSLDNNGRMGFRLQLPIGEEVEDFRACVDGQMGTIIKTYREWKISGNTNWLRNQWKYVKKALEYAWSAENEDLWDVNKTGVITGRQHHTLDMELFGPNSWLEGFYLVALKAAAEMAKALGEDSKSIEYLEIYEKGKKWTNHNLFNGKYFIQKIDIKDQSILNPYSKQVCLHGDLTSDIYWNSEAGEIKYQIGEGCVIDQVIGQWHANNCGLGEVFDRKKVKTALKSIYNYNYYESMRNLVNVWRLFSINDEGGVIICSWPENSYRPIIPLTYNSETMHGFEYQVASHMVQVGMIKESHQIVKSIREKYDGEKRNPYNEFECGSNYARSMASYALLLAYSGFEYDMTKNRIGFSPAIEDNNFSYFWSIEGAWGVFEKLDNKFELKVLYGSISLNCFSCSNIIEGKVIDLSHNILDHQGKEIFMDITLDEGERFSFKVITKDPHSTNEK